MQHNCNLSSDAFIGPLGDFSKAVEPFSEADPRAILITALTMFGNRAGRSHILAHGHQPAILFSLIVGDSAVGRKRQSYVAAKHLFQGDILQPRVESGLTSGAGLINAVRDATEFDPLGFNDKRCLFLEEDFDGTLELLQRRGNDLSAKLRGFWDGEDQQTATRNAPIKATQPHVCIIAHCTPSALIEKLSSSERSNGFFNRFIVTESRQSKSIPIPAIVDGNRFDGHRQALKDALQRAPKTYELSSPAGRVWEDYYHGLNNSRHPETIAGLVARPTFQVFRVALVFALSECAEKVEVRHLRAALAIWENNVQSVANIFGRENAPSTELIATIVDIVKAAGRNGATKTDFYRAGGNRIKSITINRAIRELEDSGEIYSELRNRILVFKHQTVPKGGIMSAKEIDERSKEFRRQFEIPITQPAFQESITQDDDACPFDMRL